MPSTPSVQTRSVRFHSYGEPAEVFCLEETTLPAPASQRIRVKVQACGLNPADWALCQGLFAGSIPRGIGLEVAGNPKRVMTISDFAAAKTLGVRSNLEEPGMRIRYDVLKEFADLAAQGRVSIPIARTFALDKWKTALFVSESHQARGKLILVP